MGAEEILCGVSYAMSLIVPYLEYIAQSLERSARTFCPGDRNCRKLKVASTKVKPMTSHDCLQKEDGYLQKKCLYYPWILSVKN